jgi:stage IV sporulation protein FB
MQDVMNEAEQVDEIQSANNKPELQASQTSVARTIISLLLYLAVDYMIFKSWYAVGVLVAVVLIHELGHLAAMKLYGYKGLNMTFVPFVGAYVSGSTDNPSRFRRCVVLLAGPLPGIIIGSIFYFLYVQQLDEQFFYPAILFLMLNVFNLIPIAPLDGGQLMENLYLGRSRNVQLVFLTVCVLAVGVGVMQTQNYPLLILLLPLLTRIASVTLKFKVRQQWQQAGLDYSKSWEELSDSDYWNLRNCMVQQNRQFARYTPGLESDTEFHVAGIIKSFLSPAAENDLTAARKFILTMLWLVFLALPVLLVLYYKGYL